MTKPCGCGCGLGVQTPDARGRPRLYRRGHNLRVDSSAVVEAARRTWTGRKHTDATKAKMSRAARGPNPNLRGARNGMYGRTGAANPNWKGGGSPERQRAYASSEYRALLRFVRRRDGYRCVECGAPRCGPKSLHVHHVKSWAEYPDLRFDAENLVTLCRGCHQDVHRKEVVPCERSLISVTTV